METLNEWRGVVLFVASIAVTLLFYISRMLTGLVAETRRIRVNLDKLTEH